MTSNPQNAAPRLSLGLPVYNAARFLDECIQSIVTQTYNDFELIVCDNASTDDTVRIVQDWARKDPRIQLHRAPVNRGAAPNFNWCFELARGELFKWCAADDVLEPTFLEKCIAELDRHPDVVLAYTGTIEIDERGAVLREIRDGAIDSECDVEEPCKRFHNLIMLMHSCISVFGVIRSSALQRSSLIGSFVGSDHVLLAQLALVGKFHRIEEHLFRNREHPNRSVRGEFTEMRKRAAWFNTKSWGPSFPFWRFFGEYSRAALFTRGLSFSDRIRCCLEVGRWIRWGYGKQMLRDLTYHLRWS